jgi:DNA-directed RNA polymerase specialized sigma24 family protein
MSAEQTAKVLRKSKAAVYTLLNRAKNSLKEKLVEEGFDNEIV